MESNNLSIKWYALLLFLLTTLTIQSQTTFTQISVEWPSWSTENKVEVYSPGGSLLTTIDDGYSGCCDNSYSTSVDLGCIADGNNYYIIMYDSYGDGWNGSANVTITTAGSVEMTHTGVGTNSSGTTVYFNVNGGCSGTCTYTVSSFPYSEGFESGLGQWTQDGSDDFDWTRNQNGTASGSTGPSGANGGSWYLYTESSSPNYPNKTAIVESPCFDLTAATSANFSFYYHMYGGSMGTLDVDLSTDNGMTYGTNLWSQSGQSQTSNSDAWDLATIDLSPYVGQTIKIRFSGTSSSSYTSDMAIDDISLTATTSPQPEINLVGNGNNISDGDLTPTTTDDTDFGSTSVGTPVDNTFTIENTGTLNLNLTGGTPIVDISGDAAFSIVTQPSATTITPSGSVTFTVRFSPTANGTVTADISIDNNDSNENPYTFRVQGTGVAPLTEGPGGVTADLQLWLKANDGLSYTDGQSVSSWNDKGRGANATVNTPGHEPTFRNNPSKNVNFNPVVEFDNTFTSFATDDDYSYDNTSTQFLEGASGYYTQDVFIVVFQDDTALNNSFGSMDVFCGDADMATNATDATGIGFGAYTGRVDNETICFALDTYDTGTPGDGYAVYDGPSSSYTTLGIINARNNSGATQQELYLNANNIGTNQNDLASFVNVNDSRYWIGRSEGWEATLNARVAEVITFSARKDDASLTDERNRIQSYLAIKYGITLGVNGTTQDYVDAAGNVIWDQSANTGYNYDIAGIGRDDDSGLNQKQSKSINETSDGTGLTNGFLTMGLTDVYDTNTDNITNNAINVNDKEFLVWGNNHADITAAPFTVNVDMSAGISGLNTPVSFIGMQRIWKVVEVAGDVPTVKVSIPQDVVRNISPPGSYLMFISDTDVFDPTADYRVMTPDGAGNLEAEYDFDGTKYITFGYAPQVVVERSVYFDGIQDYIDVGDYKDLNSAFTVSSWIKRENSAMNATILSKRDAAFTEGYDLKINNSNLIEMAWNGGADKITSNTVVPDSEWHHIAVIFNGGTAKLYIDGVLDKTTTGLSNPSNTNQSFIIAAAGKTGTTDFFEGNIDEVRIWNVALTPDQLHYIMNQEIEDNANFVNGVELPSTLTKNEVASIPWSDLAGYYPMSSYTYTNTDDLSNNHNQGALRHLDTVDFQSAPLPYESTADGSWDSTSTWLNGGVQTIPGSASIVDANVTVDWNIVRINNNVTMDNAILPSANNENRSVLSLESMTSSKLTVNNNGGLTVTHYLNLDGTIDLEGESQLIQSDGSVLKVGVDGTTENDQQGTADKFTYNYWSSPVGSNTTTATNATYESSYSVPDVMMDGSNPSSPTAINFLTSGYNGTNTTPIGIADYWIWKFANQSDGDYSSWQHVRSTGTLLPGEGFTMKGPGTGSISTPQNYVFKGKPNNGTITLPISANNDYLVGNPYPSAIDANEFLNDNPSLGGTLYFWEHWGGGSHVLAEYQGGYALYNFSGGVPTASYGTNDPDVATGGTPTKLPGRYIPVSQGFFVYSATGGSVTFENDQRVFVKEGATSTFFRTSSDAQPSTNYYEDNRMKFRIGFNSVNQIHRQLLLTIDDNATDGVDWGYDGKLNEAQMDDMYWMIGDEKFAIQATNSVNTETIIPLGITVSNNGNNELSIDHLENVPADVNIFIHDADLNVYHNLRDSNYQVYLTSGEYLDRFSLVFSNNQSLLGVDDNILNNSLLVFYTADTETIMIQNPKLLKIKSLELFNILGQSVLFEDGFPANDHSEIAVPKLSSGTYIINLVTESGTVSKKILVQ